MEDNKELSESAKEARRQYQKEWRNKNRVRLSEYHKLWSKENPDKTKAATKRYWENKDRELEG